MGIAPFHALYKASRLSSYTFGQDKLLAVFASADMEIYPYQIAAAQFALRSPYLKGAILCDDGALGKSYEAMLVIAQRWYEGKRRILLVAPTPLLKQWQVLLEEHFSLPFLVIDSNSTANEQATVDQPNPFFQDGLVLTTYDFAYEKAELVARIPWDVALFDEAHHLRRIYTGENKAATALKAATAGAFKLLLTATPMQNSIMDIYGLIYFIDETSLPDPDSFYKRYFRKPENYPELSSRVSKYCFRTLRLQVSSYVKIPSRIPATIEYRLTEPEQKLYAMINVYLARLHKAAFPKMEPYDLTLLFYRSVSSSPVALTKMLQGVLKRMEAANLTTPKPSDEMQALGKMLTLSQSIVLGAKGAELLKALHTGFAELAKKGAQKKALIFTENRTTQQALYDLLNSEYNGKVLTYHGEKSRDYTVMEQFRGEAQILIATDIAAEGFNLEFCSFVIHYDLPYNVLTMEQRISRCHRQGQQSDVLAVSFMNRDNFADVRMLELISKRTLQFSGVFGMADAVLGNFGADALSAMSTARPRQAIEQAYQETLSAFEEENQALVNQAESTLFTSFTKELAQQVAITPQYVKDEGKRLNDDLWAVTRYFFEGRWPFQVDDTTRTVSCVGSPPKVFTGAAMRRNEYSMDPHYRPSSGRHTLTGALARNILAEIFWTGVPDRGTVVVEGATEPCTIGYYHVIVKPKGAPWEGVRFDAFAGQTQDGRILSEEECRALMELPVARFSTEGETYGGRDGMAKPKQPHALDKQIDPAPFIQRMLTETASAEAEEIDRLRAHTADLKVGLARELDSLRVALKTSEAALQKEMPRLERIQAQKQAATLHKDLKQREQNLFFDGLRLEQALEEQIAELVENAKLTAEVKREFVIRVEGSNHG